MKIGGANAPPTISNQAVKTRLWPRFRCHGVARWPHLVGDTPLLRDFLLSGSGFPVSTPEFNEMAFDFWL